MTAAFRFGSRSESNLRGVNHELVNVCRLALIISNVDFGIIEGLRSRERQAELFAQGRSKPGKKVTWTLSSKHCDGLAVDLLPVNPKTGKLDAGSWEFLAGFDEIAKAMFYAADRLDVKIRWGADWDMDGRPRERGESDSPHFELVER